MKKYLYRLPALTTVTLAILLGSAVSVIADWSAPLSNPPICTAGNPGCNPPINTSNVAQTKSGNLTLSADLRVNGNVGFGIAPSATYKTEIVGTTGATDFCIRGTGICLQALNNTVNNLNTTVNNLNTAVTNVTNITNGKQINITERLGACKARDNDGSVIRDISPIAGQIYCSEVWGPLKTAGTLQDGTPVSETPGADCYSGDVQVSYPMCMSVSMGGTNGGLVRQIGPNWCMVQIAGSSGSAFAVAQILCLKK